jgi:hypothetical protein
VSGEFSGEIVCMRFARLKTLIPVPRIIHHASSTRPPSFRSTRRLVHSYGKDAWRLAGQSYRCTDYGTTHPHCLSVEVHPGSAALCRVIENARVRFRGPKRAFSNVGEFLDHYREMLMLFCTEKYTGFLLSRIPRNAAIKFTHGDLLPLLKARAL